MQRKLLYFGSKSCPPCRRIKKEFVDAELVPNLEPEQVHIILCDDNVQLAKKFHIIHTPTFVLIDEHDDEYERYIGSTHPSADEMINWLQGGYYD